MCQKVGARKGKIGVIFSPEKSKIWGVTTTPHIVPSAKFEKKVL
ncbi:hypothetical protein HMPREF9319_2077 [Streptococcus equinus ATCC 700338]|uniref:Uncharacterized protein n=1 Tax=Streptococcus equinus ATCC 700338 TaxID=864569 RepID=E0PGV4_STREI|nr:hypothetical protein HMPREF9319_2077 [Streptococcus equinus ATCC 700338]